MPGYKDEKEESQTEAWLARGLFSERRDPGSERSSADLFSDLIIPGPGRAFFFVVSVRCVRAAEQ